MRLLSYMLLILGIWLLGKAAYQQYRGITTMPAVTVREQLTGIVKSGKIERQKDPDDFRLAMTLHWFFGIVSAFAGMGLYQHIRKAERLYPFSPDFEIKEKD